MSKTKSSTKDVKIPKTKSDASVSKSSKDLKTKTKEVAQKVIGTDKKSKKDKKKAKEPTPEPESDSESEVSSSEESSESEAEVKSKKPAVNGSKKVAAKAESSDSSEESESSEDEAPAPKKTAAKKTNGAKVAAKKEESDESDSSESDSDDEGAPANAVLGKAPAVDAASSDESDSSEAEEEAKPTAKGAKVAAKAAASDSDSSEESSEDEEEKPAATSNKRKAEEQPERALKKAKAEGVDVNAGTETNSKNLFVGNLSWNVDEAMLRETFEEHGELTGVRVMYDRATNRAKGFGYVEFANAADAAAAYAAKSGFDLDGRAMNVDYSNPKPENKDKFEDRRKSYGDQLSEPSDTLFVGNLSFDVDEAAVTAAFQPYGSIASVRLPTDRETGAPKGFGYVTFQSVDEASKALSEMQGGYVGSRPLRLDYSQPRPERTDSGFGGGRGGGRGGFGGRGRGGDRGRGGFGGRGRGGDRGGRDRGAPRGTTNRGGFGDFSGSKKTFD